MTEGVEILIIGIGSDMSGGTNKGFLVRMFGSLVSIRAIAASRGSNNQRRSKHHKGESGDGGCENGGWRRGDRRDEEIKATEIASLASRNLVGGLESA